MFQVSILRSSENIPSEILNQSCASSSQITTSEPKETTKSDPTSDVKVEKSRAPKQTQPKEKKNKRKTYTTIMKSVDFFVLLILSGLVTIVFCLLL